MKPKVLQIGKYYYPEKGGIEDHLYHLCNGLKDHFDLRVFVANNESKTERAFVNGVEVVRLLKIGEFSNIPICPTMPAYLSGIDVDLIHFHMPNPMGHLACGLGRPKGKLIIMWHSDIIGRGYFMLFYKLFLNNLLHGAERIIASSPAYIEHSPFLRKFNDKAVVIPLGVDIEKLSVTTRTREKIKKIKKDFCDKIVLFVGRLSYYKGLDYLIEAMRYVDANLIIIGRGKLETKLKGLLEKHSFNNRIALIGEVSHQDISAYFHACDVFVLPSVERSEAFGITQLEAMACGKPVVSTCLDTGVPWVNVDGKTGIVVPPQDVGGLANGINQLLENSKLAEEYGRNGRQRVEQEFTKELVTKRVMNLYYDVLSG